MECKHAADLARLFADKDITTDEARRIEHHSRQCLLCRRHLQGLQEGWSLLDGWKLEKPSSETKHRLMAAVLEEIEKQVCTALGRILKKASLFSSALAAATVSLIIALLVPFDKAVKLCEFNIATGGFLALFPRQGVFFGLGLVYGMVPVAIWEICRLAWRGYHPPVGGFLRAAVFSGFLVPLLILRCSELAAGLLLSMAIGIAAGCVSGGGATPWVIRRFKSA